MIKLIKQKFRLIEIDGIEFKNSDVADTVWSCYNKGRTEGLEAIINEKYPDGVTKKELEKYLDENWKDIFARLNIKWDDESADYYNEKEV